MPAKLKDPSEKCAIGAIVRYQDHAYEVMRKVTYGMQGVKLLLEDVGTELERVVEYKEIAGDGATLVRAASKAPAVDVVPTSVECLCAESRALRST